jgi:signal transduction histidine kinase
LPVNRKSADTKQLSGLGFITAAHPQSFLQGNPTQIHQIVMNLCTNAFHAMEESGGILSISLKNKVLSREDLLNMPYMQPGKFVELTVVDTGSGIAPEIRERIFESYFTTKEVGKGTGMA